jgi:hypothetical protein
MITTTDIDEVVGAAARNFAGMLDHFRLAVGSNAFPERNLGFQLGHAFLGRFPQGAVFMEPAFEGTKHLDTLLVNDDSAIALECKRLWMPTQVGWIADDAKRLSTPLFAELGARFVPHPPRVWYSMLLVEAWNQDHAAWWEGSRESHTAWTRPESLDSYSRRSLPVRSIRSTDGRDYDLQWLYGYRRHEGVG